ncbi:hypothetical protein BAU15_03955 [Enterococcus sp. JM4C]|nr:hypothetical protein BAU15_03955 [Enterococcus sp. JM4C]
MKKNYEVVGEFIWYGTISSIKSSSIKEPVTITVFRFELPVKQPFTKTFIIETDGYEQGNE